MQMNLSELLSKGLVEKFQSNQEQIRNESMYDRAGSISTMQGKNLVEKAEIFVNKTLEILKI